MKNKNLNEAFSKRKQKETVKASAAAGQPDIEVLIPQFHERFGKDVVEKYQLEHSPRKLIFLHVEDKKAILRPPTADDLGEYMTAIGQNGLSKAVAFVMETLWLDGDFELIDDEDLFIGAFLQMNNILEGKKVDYFRA